MLEKKTHTVIATVPGELKVRYFRTRTDWGARWQARRVMDIVEPRAVKWEVRSV